MERPSKNHSLLNQMASNTTDGSAEQESHNFESLFEGYVYDNGEFDWNEEVMTYDADQDPSTLRHVSPTGSHMTNSSQLVALPSQSIEHSARPSSPTESNIEITRNPVISSATFLDDPSSTIHVAQDDFLSNPSNLLRRFRDTDGLLKTIWSNWAYVPDALKLALLKEADDQENTSAIPAYAMVNEEPFQAPGPSQNINPNTNATFSSLNPSNTNFSIQQNPYSMRLAHPGTNQFQQQQIHYRQAYPKKDYSQQQQSLPSVNQAYMSTQHHSQPVFPFHSNLPHTTFAPQTSQLTRPLYSQNNQFQQVASPRFARAQNPSRRLQISELSGLALPQYIPPQQQHRPQNLDSVETELPPYFTRQQPQYTETQWGKDPRQQRSLEAIRSSGTHTQRRSRLKTNKRTLNIAAAMRKVQQIDYVSLPTSPQSWGPIRSDTQQPVFTYTSDGEFSLDLSFTHSEVLHYFQHHPLHAGRDPKQSDLLLAIQVVPSDSNERYADKLLSSRCRFADCPDPRRKIRTGSYRVAFDEVSRAQPNLKLDPFKKSAGYVHLYCLEKHFDFPSLCRNYNIIPDTRHYKHEPKPKALSINRDHDTMAPIAAEFIANAESWNDSDNQRLDEHHGVPRDDDRHWYWKSLCYKLTKEHTTKQSATAKSTRVERKKENDLSNSVDRHWNNVDEYAAGEVKKRKEKLERIKNGSVTRKYTRSRKRKALEEEEEEDDDDDDESILDDRILDGPSEPASKRARRA